MVKKYVVKTTGRTGSHIITEYFYKKGFIAYQDYGDYNYNTVEEMALIALSFLPGEKQYDRDAVERYLTNNIVVHSHRIDWLPNDIENFNLIISLRRNKMLQTLSKIVSMNTRQNTKYPKKLESNSIHIDPDKFLRKLYKSKAEDNKLQGIVNKGWLSVQEIYYEDPLGINLDLPDILDDYYVEKSNIDYEQVVSNYDELRLIYNGLDLE